MAAASSIILTGLAALAARSVRVFCVGLDLGAYTVESDGTITVPFGADVDGLFTLARIQAYDAMGEDWGALATPFDIFIDPTTETYTVPCLVGFPYLSRGQVLRPMSEAEIKSPLGSGLAKTRRVDQVGLLLDSTIGISLGTDFTRMTEATLRDASDTVLDHATLFAGVHYQPIVDNSSFDGMVCWECSGPWPCVVVAVTSSLQTQEF